MNTIKFQTCGPGYKADMSMNPKFQEALNHLMGDAFKGAVSQNTKLPVNIKEYDVKYVIELVAPGFDKADFKMTLEKEVMTITAKSVKESEDDKVHYRRKDFEAVEFKKIFNLPKDSNMDGITAEYNNGILNISVLKKKEEEKDTAIEIKIS